jgi:hypothetical protein
MVTTRSGLIATNQTKTKPKITWDTMKRKKEQAEEEEVQTKAFTGKHNEAWKAFVAYRRKKHEENELKKELKRAKTEKAQKDNQDKAATSNSSSSILDK